MLRTRAIPLGRVGRCRVLLDPVLLVALLYLSWVLAERYAAIAALADVLPFQMVLSPRGWAVALVGAMVVGLLLHDLAHIAVARLMGLRVRQFTISLLGGRQRFTP